MNTIPTPTPTTAPITTPENDSSRVFEIKDKINNTSSSSSSSSLLDHPPPAEKDPINIQNLQNTKLTGPSTTESSTKYRTPKEQFGRDKNLTALLNDRNISAKAIRETLRTSAEPPASKPIPTHEIHELNNMVRDRMALGQNMPSRASIAEHNLRMSAPPEEDISAMLANRIFPGEHYPPSVEAKKYGGSPFQKYESETEFPPLFGEYPEDKYNATSNLTKRSDVRASSTKQAPVKRSPFQRYDSESQYPPLFEEYPEDKYFSGKNLVSNNPPREVKVRSFQRYESESEFPPLFSGYSEDNFEVPNRLTTLNSSVRPHIGSYAEDRQERQLDTRANRRRDYTDVMFETKDDIRKGFKQFGTDIKATAHDIRGDMHDAKESVRKNAGYLGQEIKETAHGIKDEAREIANESSNFLSSWWRSLTSAFGSSEPTSSERTQSAVEDLKDSVQSAKEDIKDMTKESPNTSESWWTSLNSALTPSPESTSKVRIQSALDDFKNSAYDAKTNITNTASDLADRVHGMVFNKTEPGYHGEYERYVPAIDEHGDIRDVEIGFINMTNFGN